jgi:hypothetical protein
LKNKKNDKDKKIRTPQINPGAVEAPAGGEDNSDNRGIEIIDSGAEFDVDVTAAPESAPEPESVKKPTLEELEDIDPDLLSGKPDASIASVSSKNTGSRLPSAVVKTKKHTRNEISEVALTLDGSDIDSDGEAQGKAKKRRRNAGVVFVVLAVVIVIAACAVSFFIDTGMDKKMISPLTINNRAIPSDEFSFMYHYELLEEGVDIFAVGTKEMLASAYPDDPAFPTYRDYFLNRAAQDLQTIEILYDDATSKGYTIEQAHYDRANAYINWLSGKADELGVSLDTYIKGVYGNQVDEQCIINLLAKKYFTDDYAGGEKLVELSATDDQAEVAYNEARNNYDVVSYKILRITYEQRDQAFIDTANLHAQQIIAGMNGDPSKFESVASQYFSGVAANTLATENSTLVPDCRYSDITHTNFRDWLFDAARVPGDATIFNDSDGFPIILVFVERDRMTNPLRDFYLITVNPQTGDDGSANVSATQSTAQEIYDYIDDADSCSEVENLYNDYVLAGQMTVQHNEMAYRYEYDDSLNDWIFADERKLGDKTIIEENGTFYILYYISESANPEWYDRVNSFLRMNNYQAFLNEKSAEYTWQFNDDGLEQIEDVP